MTVRNHEYFMRHALDIARSNPRKPFGSVIVDTERDLILASGRNRTEDSPVWHAELDAVHACAEAHPQADWSSLVLYSTAEPCPMCTAAIIWSGIRSIVYGTSVPSLQQLGWQQFDLRAAEVISRSPAGDTELISGVEEHDCYELFRQANP